MSGKPSARKRKRFDSSISQASGISGLSEVTRSTEESNDCEESSLNSSRQSIHNEQSFMRSSSTGNVQPGCMFTTPACRTENRRQRNVSWSVCDDEEETKVKRAFQNGYDNSCDKQQYNQTFEGIEGITRNNGIRHVGSVPMSCRNGSSVLGFQNYNYSNDRSLRTETELRKTIDFQKQVINRLLQSKHTKAQSQRLSVSVSSLGESLASGLYHEISETQRHPRHDPPLHGEDLQNEDEIDRFERQQRRSKSCDILQEDEVQQSLLSHPFTRVNEQKESSSGYGDVLEAVDNPKSNIYGKDGHNKFAETCDNNADDNGIALEYDIPRALDVMVNRANSRNCKVNFRKLLFVLFGFNTVLLLSGFLLFFVATVKEKPAFSLCLDCKELNKLDTATVIFQQKNGTCCFQSVQQLFDLFANVTQNSRSRRLPVPAPIIQEPYRESSPMVQYQAFRVEVFGNVKRVAWQIERNWPVQKKFEGLGPDRNTLISIPESGNYFLYSRVSYIKNFGLYNTGDLKFGYTVLLVRPGENVILDSVEETCFQRNTSVRLTSQLSFVHNFTKDDTFYVEIYGEEFVDTRSSKLGLFLLQTTDTSIKNLFHQPGSAKETVVDDE